MTEQKQCSICHKWYPATTEFFYFARGKKYPDKLATNCKACRAAYEKQRYAEKGEQIRQQRKERYWEDPEKARQESRDYLEANRETINQRKRERHAANPEAKSEADKRYRVKNLKKIRARQRQWELENPDKVKATKQRYYGRKKEAKTDYTGEDWQRALDYFHGCCAVCGRPLNDLFDTHRAAADHWIPLAKGGSTTADNIIPLCSGFEGCNNSKKDKMPKRWLTQRLGGKKKAQAKLEEIEAYFKWAMSERKD